MKPYAAVGFFPICKKLFAGAAVSVVWGCAELLFGLRGLCRKGGCKMEKKNIIELKDIVVEFDGERIIDGLNLSIKDKEFVTLLGPSGCGKTTTLRIIAGFVEPNSGEVLFDCKEMSGIPPYKRHVNTIFQRYALFPHLNVYDNVAFGLKVSKTPKDEIKKRVDEMLALVGLTGFEKRSVTKLSGGQQQRVAIARAVINRPKVLLLDEPLAALDLKLRQSMQLELKKIQQKLGITFVYVTHDQEEALSMSDTIVVMNDGKIQQIGTPIDIYNEPQNAFVADFIGESNIIPGIMKRDLLVNFLGQDFDCVDKGFLDNEAVDVVIRPEDIKIIPAENAKLTAKVESCIFKGVHYEMTMRCDDFEWLVQSTKFENIGDTVGINVLPDDIHIMKKSDVPIYSEEDGGEDEE